MLKKDKNEWIFTKNKVPKENHTVKIYALRKKSENKNELIEGFYEEGKFLIFDEIGANMKEIDSVFAWKYRN